jgi:signal transduction histidine kinase
MTVQLALLGGWATAAGAGALALLAWRALTARIEAIARACHELRGPITAARLGLQLSARSGELSTARLRAIDLELGRASLALEDLTSSRQHGCAPRTLERVDVAALLGDSVQAWQPAAGQRGVELAVRWPGAPAYVVGDRLRLAQATGNLIANAIEHGAGPIEAGGRTDGPVVRIEISDHGPGLPAPVGELSRRGRRRSSHRGRGLEIAAGIAAAHGGRLAAAPSESGARLVLELPASAPAPLVSAAPAGDR